MVRCCLRRLPTITSGSTASGTRRRKPGRGRRRRTRLRLVPQGGIDHHRTNEKASPRLPGILMSTTSLKRPTLRSRRAIVLAAVAGVIVLAVGVAFSIHVRNELRDAEKAARTAVADYRLDDARRLL